MLYFGGEICKEVGCKLLARTCNLKDIVFEQTGFKYCWYLGYLYEITAKAVIDKNCLNKEPYLFTLPHFKRD